MLITLKQTLHPKIQNSVITFSPRADGKSGQGFVVHKNTFLELQVAAFSENN